MAGQIERRSERNWYWDEVDPKTRVIVGALEAADLIPAVEKPSLEKRTVAAAIKGFGVTSEQVSQTWYRSMKKFAELDGLDYDADAIPKAIVDGLRACESEETREVISELGRCAGRRSWTSDLALQAADQILSGDDPYKAIPSLHALSTLAMHRLATTKMERGPVQIADPPTSVPPASN